MENIRLFSATGKLNMNNFFLHCLHVGLWSSRCHLDPSVVTGTWHFELTIVRLFVTSPPVRSGVLWSACLCVCVFVYLSDREHISETAHPIVTKFMRVLAIAVARSFTGGVAIRYVLPVLWMTSLLRCITDRIQASQCRCSEWRRPHANAPAASYWLRCDLDDGGRRD